MNTYELDRLALKLVPNPIREDASIPIEILQEWEKHDQRDYATSIIRLKNALTRQDRLLCKKCGSLLYMYRTPRCFHCTKPELTTHVVCEFLPAKWWLKNNAPGFTEKVWERIEEDYISTNDCYMKLPASEGMDNDPEIQKQFELLEKHFGKNIIWWVSW